MAHEYKLSSAAAAKDLDKAFASAGKALSMLGIKLALKKPDMEKLGSVMGEKAKKAEFRLLAKGSVLTAVVDIGGSLTPLGEFDVEAEKDLEKRRKVLKELIEAGFREYEAELERLSDGPDPKLAANQISKEIAKVTKAVAEAKDFLQKLQAGKQSYLDLTYKKLKSIPEKCKEFETYAVANYNKESVLFLKAVEQRMANDKLITLFISKDAQYLINIPGPLSADILANKVPAANAARQIETMLESDLMVRFSALKSQQYDKPIEAVTRKLAPIEAHLKGLQEQKRKLAA